MHGIIGNPTKSVSLIKFMLSRSRVQFAISRHTFHGPSPLPTPRHPTATGPSARSATLARRVPSRPFPSPTHRTPHTTRAGGRDLIRRKSFCRAENPFVLFISVDENSFSTEAINPKESERQTERTGARAYVCERDSSRKALYTYVANRDGRERIDSPSPQN